MPYAPLISKIRCHNPNRTKSGICNRNYLTYIGTREGVDLTDPEFEKHIQEQLIKSDLTNDADDSYMQSSAGNDLYVKYIAERPKSHGLFGNIDVADLTKVGNAMATMTRNGKNIYRGIVSLSEKDALNLGFDNKSAWMNYMKSVMPDIGNQFGISLQNLNWCAAVHMAKGHPHCHYMFWDASDKISSSFIHPSLQNKCRQLLSKEMFAAEYHQEIINKTTSRDNILSIGKDIMKESKSEIIHEYQAHLPGNMSDTLSQDFQKYFKELINSLPDSGRITYKLIPADLKEQVNHITLLLLSHPDLQKEVAKYYESTEKISEAASATGEQKQWSKNKAKIDLEKRIGNIILTTAKSIRQEFSKIDYQNERSAEFKEMQKEALVKYGCYSVFSNIFSSVMRQNQRSSWNTDKVYRSKSKENMIAHARMLKNHQGYNELEES